MLARIYDKVLKKPNAFCAHSVRRNLRKPKYYGTDENCLTWGNLWTTSQLALLCSLMVSLPELENAKRYWLEIWFGDSTWKAGGPRALLPTRGCPQKSFLAVLIGKIFRATILFWMSRKSSRCMLLFEKSNCAIFCDF